MTGRWADSAEDVARETALRKEKELKKRLKKEKEAAAAREAAVQEARRKPRQAEHDDEENGHSSARSAKRRKVTPEAEGDADASNSSSGSKLLRFQGGRFGKSRSVENYEKLNDIEEGTYGFVTRAKEITTGKVVALKRLKIEPNDRNGLPVTGLREIQILKDCDHRNIVRLQEVVVGNDTTKIENIFLVLDFVEHDVKTVLEDMPQPFLASEVKTLLSQLAAGVAYLHKHWILHRDLKTSNLLLNNRGTLKIADFGMARYVGDPPPHRLTKLVVTLWYRAPELLLGTRRYDAAVDMWSVGCIFGELLTREPLLRGRDEVDQLTKIFELCGVPSEETWPGFRRLPNALSLKLPSGRQNAGSVIRAKFPLLTTAGAGLLNALLSLDPAKRPTAKEMLGHEYFRQDPRPKSETLFPTFPSKAGQESRRRRDTPNAPGRGDAAELGAVDLSGIFSGREKEERGGGFSLKMV